MCFKPCILCMKVVCNKASYYKGRYPGDGTKVVREIPKYIVTGDCILQSAPIGLHTEFRYETISEVLQY